MKNHPLISIIILNWNGKDHLEECLASLQKTTCPNLEIIVVDNASTDQSEEITHKFNNTILIKNRQNVGYAAGCNTGFKLAKGKYLISLNNDIVVSNTWLDEPVAILENDDRVGIISCCQMQYFEKDKIDGLFHQFNLDLSVTQYGYNKYPDKVNSKKGYILSANGGSAIFRKSMIDEIGGFDERFFGYYEDADLCLRAFAHGWKCVYSPSAIVFHKGSESFNKTGITKMFLRERNRILFLYKNIPADLIVTRLPFLLLFELRVIRIFLLKLKEPKKYLKARTEDIKSLPLYRSIRKENLKLIRKNRRLFNTLINKKIIHFD